MGGSLDSANLEIGPANVYLEEGGEDQLLGYMGDELVVKMGTDASPLTGAQKGTTPLDKVVTGGHFQITVPFKEITLENFARAFPNSSITGDKTRVDFKVRVGLSLRSLAKKMTIKKLLGGVESTDVADHTIIPEASPAEGEVSVTFSPTGQRVINATFDAWPNDTTGRWAYAGDEAGS